MTPHRPVQHLHHPRRVGPRPRQRPLAPLLCSAALATGLLGGALQAMPPRPALPGTAAPGAAADWQRATQAFQAGRHAEAFGVFAHLATAGDAEAARIALFMLDHGPRLYGHAWGATPAEHARWQQQARQARAPAPDGGHSGE